MSDRIGDYLRVIVPLDTKLIWYSLEKEEICFYFAQELFPARFFLVWRRRGLFSFYEISEEAKIIWSTPILLSQGTAPSKELRIYAERMLDMQKWL